MSEPITLAPESVEAIARRVVELLRVAGVADSTPERPADLVDAAEVADRFSVSRDYVYEHAAELGAVRLGTGPKARLRFNPERVLEALSPQPVQPTAEAPTTRRSRPRRTSVDLLPIGRKR